MKIETPNFKLHGRLKKIFSTIKIDKKKMSVMSDTLDFHDIDVDNLEDMDLVALMIFINNYSKKHDAYVLWEERLKYDLETAFQVYNVLEKTKYKNGLECQKKLESLNLLFYTTYYEDPKTTYVFLQTPEFIEGMGVAGDWSCIIDDPNSLKN